MNIIIFQLINYTLSFLMWMVLGRIILSLIIGGRQNIMTTAFEKVTEPVYRVTQKIFPFAKGGWTPALAILLIIAARLALVMIFKPASWR
ncbi:MAG: YggT family protein [Nitrospirae bacterium]|nr:YggT family protein [Nitrospirota bacterium]